jgi:protein TonB
MNSSPSGNGIRRSHGIVGADSGFAGFVRDKEMRVRLTSAFLLVSIAAFGAARLVAQSNDSAQSTGTPAAPAQGRKIITKDPEYAKLLDPPKESAYFQTYSKSYRDASAEINSKFMEMTDVSARDQARKQEWEQVLKNDGDKFQYEADTTFRDAKVSFAQAHRDAWLPIGPVYYDSNNSVLRAKAFTDAPVVANVRVPMTPADLQKLYDKYHALFADEIDRTAHEYVSKAGAGSNCSRAPDLCYKLSYKDIEENMRANRIVAFGQGDFEAGRIDRLFLGDFDTEMLVLDLGAANSEISNIAWRFSPGPVPKKPAEPEPVETQTASAPANPSAPAAATAPPAPETAPPASPGQTAQSDAAKSAAGGPSATPAPSPAAAKSSGPPVVVPASVEAASIVTQAAPAYPPEARAKLIQGEVLLRAIIDKEGKISEVHVLSGDDALAPAAVEAVRQWRYKPMLVDGEAREVDTTITVTFSLKN